jgi:hypothetical protein
VEFEAKWAAADVARQRELPHGDVRQELPDRGVFRAIRRGRQAELVVRTDHQSVGVTPAEFLDVLEAVAPVVVAEPALSTYWQYRAELEQVLKQERQG